MVRALWGALGLANKENELFGLGQCISNILGQIWSILASFYEILCEMRANLWHILVDFVPKLEPIYLGGGTL